MPLLDTTFAVDLLRGRAEAARLLRLLEQGTGPLGVSAITYYELYRGVGQSGRPDEERRKVDDLLRSLLVFPVEAEAAKQAGLLRAQLDSEGASVDPFDLLIGCTALHHGEDVVTRNRRDFERIPGLQVLHY